MNATRENIVPRRRRFSRWPYDLREATMGISS